MRAISKSRGTKIVLDKNDIAELLKNGKLHGGYKGHRFLVTAPPTQIGGVSQEQHQEEIEKHTEEHGILLDIVAELTTEAQQYQERLDGYEKTIKSRGKEIKKLRAKVKDTIPIEEHEDLMSAKFNSHQEVLAALEDAQAAVVGKLEDEIDVCKDSLKGYEGKFDQSQEAIDKLKNDLADCEN